MTEGKPTTRNSTKTLDLMRHGDVPATEDEMTAVAAMVANWIVDNIQGGTDT